MIIRQEDLKSLCDYISKAIDSTGETDLTSSIELKGKGNYLYACVSNREYYVESKVDLDEPVDIKATVDASLFIKLVARITNNTVELEVSDKYLNVTADGKYKLPLVFDDDEMLEIDEISIDSVDTEFELSRDTIDSIIAYNLKEIKKVSANPIKQMCFIDSMGALTFSSGGCVNTFNTADDVKILLPDKVLSLLKVFTTDKIKVSVGKCDTELLSTSKVRFENEFVTATAILNSGDSLINSFPSSAIRGRANKEYTYNIEVRKELLTSALNRLLLFIDPKSDKKYCSFTFSENKVIIDGIGNDSKEFIYYENNVAGVSYKTELDISELKYAVDKASDSLLTLSFGDNQAVVLSHGNIKIIFPEIHFNGN